MFLLPLKEPVDTYNFIRFVGGSFSSSSHFQAAESIYMNLGCPEDNETGHLKRNLLIIKKVSLHCNITTTCINDNLAEVNKLLDLVLDDFNTQAPCPLQCLIESDVCEANFHLGKQETAIAEVEHGGDLPSLPKTAAQSEKSEISSISLC